MDEAISQNADFEVGIVCVPHNQHLATTLKLLDAGKSVIKEKPLAFKSSGARLLETHATEKNLDVMTICQRNADPFFSKAFTMLGEIGVPYSFVYRYFLRQEKTSGWRAKEEFAEGGVVLDMGYHAVDMVRKFFGSPDHVTSMLTYANSETADTSILPAFLSKTGMLSWPAIYWGMDNQRAGKDISVRSTCFMNK